MFKQIRTALGHRRLALSLALLLPASAGLAQSIDYTGGWWRADESGWGLFTIDQGNVLLPTWFTYDVQGQASWFVIGGASLQSDGSYLGDVYRFTGVPFTQINGRASETGTKVGSARLRFPARDRMLFDYTIDGISQSKQLDRFVFDGQQLECSGSSADPAGFSNYTALWWNPDQSGWGVQINHVGDLLSATWYTYGEDRKPAWFVFNATRQADGRYTGPLLRGRTGTRFDQINGQPAVGQIEEVGTVSLRFTNGAAGEFSYTIGGSTRSVQISRAEFGARSSECRSVPATPVGEPSAGDECYPPLRVGDRFLLQDGSGGRIEQRVTGTSTYKGRPVFVLEDRIVGDNSATVREFIEQTDTHRIYLGGEGFIRSANAQGTYEYEPPVEIPRLTPVGTELRRSYVVKNRYTAMGMQVAADVQTEQLTVRTGSADVSAPAGTFNGACSFDTRVTLNSTVNVAGFSVSTRTEGRTLLSAHPSVGTVRSEQESTSTTSAAGAPPSSQTTRTTSVLVEAEVNGRRYP
ncbi:hypothetical protein [Aquimonas voraii]|uniref:Uncharacterized protein n=1 Tax=Aquimonas voraii TaxID=265719 RepID=A0A1G6U8W6_9GAMM|nr:hypothetical protein [Aquimonas voraii]SDD37146.1 hypothetical protein SAMN04488509_102198 [Aquimonas voraii]